MGHLRSTLEQGLSGKYTHENGWGRPTEETKEDRPTERKKIEVLWIKELDRAQEVTSLCIPHSLLSGSSYHQPGRKGAGCSGGGSLQKTSNAARLTHKPRCILLNIIFL